MSKKKSKKKSKVKVPKRIVTMTAEARAVALIEATAPLLEMFAVLDAVFTDDGDALDSDKRQITVGRVYEQWKRTRAALDPSFDPKAQPRVRMGGASVFRGSKGS